MSPNTASPGPSANVLAQFVPPYTCAGFWMDNDVVLYQDVSHLLATSYQFVMRW
jgi:hypothetical protein